jgi:glucokinase
VIEAAAGGDCLGLHVLGREASLLAQALLSVVAVLDSTLLLLGGGVGSNPHLRAPVQEQLDRLMLDAPPVRIAALGDKAALVGAAEIALSLSESGKTSNRLR